MLSGYAFRMSTDLCIQRLMHPFQTFYAFKELLCSQRIFMHSIRNFLQKYVKCINIFLYKFVGFLLIFFSKTLIVNSSIRQRKKLEQISGIQFRTGPHYIYDASFKGAPSALNPLRVDHWVVGIYEVQLNYIL